MTTKSKKSKATKKKDRPVLKHWLVQKLRRISYSWPPRQQAIKNSRVERGKYRCAICLGENFGPKDIQLDHIDPVVDEEAGFVDFNTYIDRLFCKVEGFQTLCRACHEAKTFFEQNVRRQVKREKEPEDDI